MIFIVVIVFFVLCRTLLFYRLRKTFLLLFQILFLSIPFSGKVVQRYSYNIISIFSVNVPEKKNDEIESAKKKEEMIEKTEGTIKLTLT